MIIILETSQIYIYMCLWKYIIESLYHLLQKVNFHTQYINVFTYIVIKKYCLLLAKTYCMDIHFKS